MFSSTGWALKRLYKFVLKQLLGRVLKNELDLDQLDVALGSGTVELRNLVLDCDYLSEQLAELPIIVVTGEVSTVKASIPWTALGSQSCVIELGDLYLRIAPRPALSDFSSEVHGSGSEEDEPVDEPTYLAADDGIHVIAALVEKVLLRMQVRINGLSIDIQGQEPRAHIPQPGSPSAEELPTPFLHVLVARVEYEAQAPPEAGERPVPLEDALKHIKCEGVVLELSEQVVTDAPEPTSEEELTGSLCCEESHCIFSSPDSASSVSAAVQLKLGRPADPLAPLKVDLSLVLSPVQLSLSPNRIAIIKRLLESFTGEEDATQPAPPPPAPLRPTPKTTASSVCGAQGASSPAGPSARGHTRHRSLGGGSEGASHPSRARWSTGSGSGSREFGRASRNCSAHGIITDLFRMEGAMSMAEALPWVMDSAVSGGALPSAAAARPGAQSDSSVVPAVASAAVVANTAVTAAAMSADLAASVEEFFDCYDGSMLSSRRTDDGSASALDASGSNTQLWAWASTAWSSIQQSGLAGGMEEPSSQPVPSMELQVHVVSELVVLATAMTDAPLQGGAEGAGTTMGWMAVEASRCQVSAHIAAAQRDLSVELGALTVRHTLTPPAGVESAETSLVAAALPPWPAGAGPDLLVAEEPPAPPNGAAASPILRIGNPRASPAGGALSLKLHLSQGSQTPPPREAPASKGEVRGPGGPLPAAAGALQCSLHVPPAMLWVDDAAVVQLLHLAHAMLSAASPETPPREVGAAAPRPKEAPLPPRLTLDVQMPYLRAVGRFGAAGAPHRTGEVDPQRSFICLEVLGLPAPPPIATDGPPRPSGTVAVDAAAAMLSFERGSRQGQRVNVRVGGVRVSLLGARLAQEFTWHAEQGGRACPPEAVAGLPCHCLLDCPPPGGWLRLNLMRDEAGATEPPPPVAVLVTWHAEEPPSRKEAPALPRSKGGALDSLLAHAWEGVRARAADCSVSRRPGKRAHHAAAATQSSAEQEANQARQAVWSAAQVTIDVRLRQVVVVDVADAVHTHAVDMVQAAVDGWLTVLEELQASGAAPATVACSVGDTPAWALKVESAAASISVLRSTPGGDAGRMLRVWAEGLAAFQAASPAAGRSCTQIWAREWGVHGELEQDSAASGTTAARTATCELLCCNEASKGGGAPKGLAVELLSRPQAGSRHGACGDDLPVSETVIGVECWGLALKTLHGDLRFSWLQDLAACLQAPAPEAAPPPAQEAETQTVVCVDIHDLLLCHCPAESDDDGGGSASDAMSSGSWGAASASLAPAPPVPGALCVRHVALLSQDPALASRGGFLAAGQAPGRSQPPECSAPRLMTTLRSAVLHVVADAAGGLYKGAALPCSFAALHAEGYTRVARDVSLEVRLGQEGGSGKGSAATEVLEVRSSHLEVDTEPEAFAALSAFITQCIDGLTTAEPSEEALARPPVEVPAAGAVDGAPTQRHRPLPEAPAMRAKPGSSEGAPPGPPAAGASWPAGARSADSPGQSSRGLATGGVLVGVEENVFGHGRGERSNGGMPSGRASAEQQGGDDVVGPSSGGGSAAAMHHVQHGVADAGCEGRRPAEGAAVERCGRSEARRGRGGSGGGGPELHAVMPRFIEDYCPEEPAGDGSAAPTVAATAALLANARLHGVLGTTGGKEGAAQDDYRAFWYGPGPSTIENHVAVAARQARQRQGSAGGKVGARGAAADTAAEGSFAGQQHPVALAPQAPHLPPVTFRVRVHCLQFTWCLVGQLPAGAVGPSGAPVEEEVPQAEQRVQVRLEELGVQYAVFEEGHHYASQLSVSVHELEVNDLSLGAIGEQVLRYYVHAKTPRESQAAMLSAQLEAVRPDPANLLETEYRFELKLPPLQIFLDQRVLAFLENFARASADMGAAAAAGKKAEAPLEESAMSDASERSASHVAPSEPCSMAEEEPMFFQRAEVSVGRLYVDYHARHVDYGALCAGSLWEFINLVPWNGVELKLRPACVSGVHGWDAVLEGALGEWQHDISKQLHKFVQGVAPVKSLCTVGNGTAQLVLEPLKQYRREGRVLRGLQKGTAAFMRSVTLEALGLGAHVAGGARHVLESAERGLGEGPPQGGSPLGTARNGAAKAGHSARRDEPGDALEGLQRAARTLTQGLGDAADVLVSKPMRRYSEGAGASAAIASAIRAVPRAAVTPAAAAATAMQQTLVGVRNGLHVDSSTRRVRGGSTGGQ
ncbi:hypothetical protein CYMTET_15502 [Cymbomonas tetramitiformis]|uniref:Autophagy-related protein 2 n=1 Tax=Cymbomonas tetramitiformis TaxID=36881 RepID=A0AAE0GE75_9CHLO|nr:hypothetical protein CYMTET_15502 [Cymbomonas tetramitiformis]